MRAATNWAHHCLVQVQVCPQLQHLRQRLPCMHAATIQPRMGLVQVQAPAQGRAPLYAG